MDYIICLKRNISAAFRDSEPFKVNVCVVACSIYRVK